MWRDPEKTSTEQVQAEDPLAAVAAVLTTQTFLILIQIIFKNIKKYLCYQACVCFLIGFGKRSLHTYQI